MPGYLKDEDKRLALEEEQRVHDEQKKTAREERRRKRKAAKDAELKPIEAAAAVAEADPSTPANDETDDEQFEDSSSDAPTPALADKKAQ